MASDFTRVHSDNHLWLVMDAYHIALEEGSVSYLDTQAPYFDGGSGTIWEHIKQSILPAILLSAANILWVMTIYPL